MIAAAKQMRDPKELARVADDRPGWYRWWAPAPATQSLLGDFYEDLDPRLTHGTGELEGLRCIYVGVAIKESLRKRIDWHINQRHTDNHIKHGTLSTLRQSISSLVGPSPFDEKATDDLIDQLTVEYYPKEFEIGSLAAKTEILLIENQELEQNILPLNISKNHRSEMAIFKRELKSKRKSAKQKWGIMR